MMIHAEHVFKSLFGSDLLPALSGPETNDGSFVHTWLFFSA